MKQKQIRDYLRREWRRDRLRWMGLILALIGGIMAVIAGFRGNFAVVGIFGVIFIIGLYLESRPTLYVEEGDK